MAGEPTEGIAISWSPWSSAGADFGGLEVRDAQNRPVTTAAETAELQDIFQQDLFQLMVVAAPHHIAAAEEGLILFSALIKNSFLHPIDTAIGYLFDALAPNSKRVVHNVGNLWITISVGVFCFSRLLACFQLHRSSTRLNLRC